MIEKDIGTEGGPRPEAPPLPPQDWGLLAALPPARWAANGVPSRDLATDRERAAALVRKHLSDISASDGVRVSALGAAWSSDIDVHITTLPPEERLRALGWLPVDRLLRRLGIRGTHRWAVIEEGRVLTAVDLQQGAPPDPVQAIVARCRRRGEVRIREVLELRTLVRAGRNVPSSDPVIRAAAVAEAALGGTVLGRWLRGPPRPPPVSIPGLKPLLRRRGRRLRHRRVVIAVSGVDGSGKSTVCRSLHRDLQRIGVPVSVVWTRPGMRIGRLDLVARVAKRLLGQGSAAGVTRVAGGEGALVSRRGVIGMVWALSISLAFLRDVRRRHRRGSGILLYDRHLADALVMLDVAYAGVDLRAPEALIRRFLPASDLTFYLELPPEVAAARKPDDAFGPGFVKRQAERYRVRIQEVKRLRRLDGSRPPAEVAREALGILLGGA